MSAKVFVTTPVNPTTDEHQEYYRVFLAGPITGGGDWQQQAIQLLSDNVKVNLLICNPKTPDGQRVTAKEQLEWELKHMRIAHYVIFWLPKEDPTAHRCDRAYAQTTRIEIGMNLHRLLGTRGTVSSFLGVQTGFSGEGYIRNLLEHANVRVFNTLEDVCTMTLFKVHHLHTMAKQHDLEEEAGMCLLI